MCGRHLAQARSSPALVPLSHHIATHAERTLAEVTGTAEIFGSVVRKKKAERWIVRPEKSGEVGRAVVRDGMSRRMKNVAANEE